jgi:hypothetical protein
MQVDPWTPSTLSNLHLLSLAMPLILMTRIHHSHPRLCLSSALSSRVCIPNVLILIIPNSRRLVLTPVACSILGPTFYWFAMSALRWSRYRRGCHLSSFVGLRGSAWITRSDSPRFNLVCRHWVPCSPRPYCSHAMPTSLKEGRGQIVTAHNELNSPSQKFFSTLRK